MSNLKSTLGVALLALASCATGPGVSLTLPAEPLPDLFAPATWRSTCDVLLSAPGTTWKVRRRGCALAVDRAPLGEAELSLAFDAGLTRFTAATLTHRDAPPCALEKPVPAGCGAEPSFELTQAWERLRRAVEQRLGPPIATLEEGGNRSVEWHQPGWTLVAGLNAPAPGSGWTVTLRAAPERQEAAAAPTAGAPR